MKDNDTEQLAIQARGLSKHYGRVVALDNADFDLRAGEILAVIGDNGAGKSTLIKALSGAVTPDSGQIWLGGEEVAFKSPLDARVAGIETVYQNLALSPALSISDNMFLGREIRQPGFRGRYLRMLDRREMERRAREHLSELGLLTIQNITQAVETLSGGAALGVKESRRVLELIQEVRERGLAIVLISHNMPHVFEVADRVHVHRLGQRLCVVDPASCSMSDAVAIMTGAMPPPAGTES